VMSFVWFVKMLLEKANFFFVSPNPTDEKQDSPNFCSAF